MINREVGYNEALFENMAFFADGVWEVDVNTAKVKIIYEKITPEAMGRIYDLESIQKLITIEAHPDDVEALLRRTSLEYLKSLKESVGFTGKSYIGRNGKHAYRNVMTPEFDENHKVRKVYVTFFDDQERLDRQHELEGVSTALKSEIKKKQRSNEILGHISNMLTSSENLKDGINQVLAYIGNVLGATRVFIFEDEEDANYSSNTFEWCAPGIESIKDKLQHLNYDLYGYKQLFEEDYVLNCTDTSKLENEYFANFFSKYQTKATIQYCILDDGEFCGFIGVADNKKTRDDWGRDLDDSVILEHVSNLLSMYLIKERNFQRALQANRAKSAFISNLSYDLREPMNAIKGFVKLAKNHLDDKEKLEEYLEKINISSDNLVKLINDVLDISRIEAGKLKIQEEAILVMDVVDDTRAIVLDDIRAKNIHATFEEIDIEKEYVWCDRMHLDQVVLNCLFNAIKLTPEGGELKSQIRQLPCDLPGFINYELKLTDNGAGMSPQDVADIMNAGDKYSDNKKLQGAVLGMTIVKNIVDMMQGELIINSEPGKGTEVIVSLTLEKAKQDLTSSEFDDEIKEYKLNGLKVLLAEADIFNAEIENELLKEAGVFVDTVRDGFEVVSRVQTREAGTYDVVLLDIKLPVMDGFEVAKCIRELPDKELAKIPIIAMTGNAFDEDRKKALDVGMNGRVTKPLKPEEIVEILNGDTSYVTRNAH